MNDEYADYVEHPRYGRCPRPRVTGLNPETDFTTGRPFLHSNATARIANTADENLEMAECCLSLIEGKVFDRHQTERVRQLLKHAETRAGITGRSNDIRARLNALES